MFNRVLAILGVTYLVLAFWVLLSAESLISFVGGHGTLAMGFLYTVGAVLVAVLTYRHIANRYVELALYFFTFLELITGIRWLGGNNSGTPMFVCIGFVLVNGILFCLPYLIEHRLDSRVLNLRV